MNTPRLADLFTMGNLAAGVASILMTEPLYAAGFILLGALFDVLDGMVARWMRQTSPLGVQLDSLADMVTFGVAPAILFYHMLPENIWATMICLLIPIMSGWRLANFNLLPPSPVFQGLPTPANALWYASITLWLPDSYALPSWMTSPEVHLLISLCLSILLISKCPIPSFKTPQLLKNYWLAWILGLAAGGASIILGIPSLAISATFLGLLTGFLMQPFFINHRSSK